MAATTYWNQWIFTSDVLCVTEDTLAFRQKSEVINTPVVVLTPEDRSRLLSNRCVTCLLRTRTDRSTSCCNELTDSPSVSFFKTFSLLLFLFAFILLSHCINIYYNLLGEQFCYFSSNMLYVTYFAINLPTKRCVIKEQVPVASVIVTFHPDADGRIILRWIFRKWERIVGTGWSWIRIGTGGGHLWVRWWTFEFQKMRGISWLAADPVSFSRRTLLHGVSK